MSYCDKLYPIISSKCTLAPIFKIVITIFLIGLNKKLFLFINGTFSYNQDSILTL